MKSVLALIRINWLTFSSYQMNVVFSLAGLVALFVPVYLVAGSIQPIAAESIADEGGVYFGFLVVGLAVMQIVGTSMRGLPDAISAGITSGTLESLFATPARLPGLLVGLTGFGMLWAAFRSALLISGIAIMGGGLSITGIPLALFILVLLILAHLPIGILMASGILIFRTTGPILPAIAGAFSLLGGVYYSTDVIPAVVRPLADWVPLAYGLRAFRRVLLSGEPFATVSSDVAALGGFAVVLLLASLIAFRWSMAYARRTGTLAQY